ncbi:MAG: hypothetical protein EPN93_08415 [Spirochaetes bacterium]|nr:MAG: hypothetical protein EPN93_08415 [Spirochaetota bacterium]
MGFLYILAVYMFFMFFLLTVNYYIHLLSSKDQYTREELSNILPYISGYLAMLGEKYHQTGFMLALLPASLVGLLIPQISDHWFFSSAILFVIAYLLLPVLKERFESTRVMASDSHADDILNFLARHAGVLVIGLGGGMGSSLMYTWARDKELGFLWFILNLSVLIVLMEFALAREYNEQ